MWHVILAEYRKSKCLYHIERDGLKNKITKMEPVMKKILLVFTLVAVLMLPVTVAAEEPEASVRVNAPEFVSGTFEVTIDVEDVTDFDSGQFDLLFDPDVVSFVDVEPGSIDVTEVPVDMFRLMGAGMVRVLFNIKGADGVSGSGCLSKVIFETKGAQGDASTIDISKGLLVKPNPGTYRSPSDGAPKILADWFNDTVTIGIAPSTPVEAPTPTQAPTIAAASAPEPTVTSIRTSAPDPDSPIFTARAGDASAVAASGGLQDLLTPHNFITIYSWSLQPTQQQ